MIDIKKYSGTANLFNFDFSVDFSKVHADTFFLEKYKSNFFVLNGVSIQDDVLSTLRDKEKYPVGFNGLPNNSEIGSYRTTIWNKKATDDFSDVVKRFLPNNLYKEKDYYIGDNFRMCSPYYLDKEYTLMSSTPYIRYMEYMANSNAKHAPHYDAPFYGEGYLTLFSWVLYLDDCTDGNFDFINDGFSDDFKSRTRDNFSDFERMSDNILVSVTPKVGKMLIFPHWLCHQANEFTTNKTGMRRIMRGDIAYAYQ